MVRKNELRETSDLTKELSSFLKDELEKKNKTAQDIADALERSYTYAYLRVQGLKSFTLDELDEVAKVLEIKSVYELIAAVREYTYTQLKNSYTEPKTSNIYEDFFDSLDLAANEDINKNLERDLDDFGA